MVSQAKTQAAAFELLVEALEDDKRKRGRSLSKRVFNGKFIGENVAKGVFNALGMLIVYGIVAWLIIRLGWSSLKDAMAVRTMSVVQTVPNAHASQLPPKM